jgi:4-amino-4-deoxy-L-arabinose transferase-like glycosyltransferase
MSQRYKLLLPLGIFAVLFFPFLGVIPSADGSLEFLQSKHWLLGGNLIQLMLDHPPFKLMIVSAAFKLFGYQSICYIGLFFGMVGIIATYYIAKKLFDEKVAFLSSILMATSGLFISVGLFSIRDFLMTVFILLAFAFYLNTRYALYALFICLAVLTKETAIFFAAGILFSDIIIKKNMRFSSFTPFIVLAWYFEFIHFSGNHIWNDWNFSKTANQGSAATMIINVLTLQIFNQYAYENWLHLFIFNFNWVYWIFGIISFFSIKTKEMKKNLAPIAVFFILFSVMVLSFQTFTINRYVLPILPFLYIMASFGIFNLKFKPFFIALIILISFVSLFYSVDPISNMIWQKTTILGENVYLNKSLDGDDGITYNMQYLEIMKNRTEMIEANKCTFSPIIAYNVETLRALDVTTCK